MSLTTKRHRMEPARPAASWTMRMLDGRRCALSSSSARYRCEFGLETRHSAHQRLSSTSDRGWWICAIILPSYSDDFQACCINAVYVQYSCQHLPRTNIHSNCALRASETRAECMKKRWVAMSRTMSADPRPSSRRCRGHPSWRSVMYQQDSQKCRFW